MLACILSCFQKTNLVVHHRAAMTWPGGGDQEYPLLNTDVLLLPETTVCSAAGGRLSSSSCSTDGCNNNRVTRTTEPCCTHVSNSSSVLLLFVVFVRLFCRRWRFLTQRRAHWEARHDGAKSRETSGRRSADYFPQPPSTEFLYRSTPGGCFA